MGDWSLGSVSATVMDLVPSVPTALSGTRILEISDRKRQYVEEYVGETIGSNAIGVKYQDIIVNLTAAQVCRSMILTGVDASSVSLGDFTINKGKGTNVETAAEVFENMAMEQLRSLGRSISFFKALG